MLHQRADLDLNIFLAKEVINFPSDLRLNITVKIEAIII